MKLSLGPSALAALLLVANTTNAQPTRTGSPGRPAASPPPDYTEQAVDGGTVVTFPGDPLPGAENDPYGGIVRAPPRVLRVGLIRPRMNFLPELLKSAENL